MTATPTRSTAALAALLTAGTLRSDRADELIASAIKAYKKAGGREQPSSASDITDVDGVITITLRNISGVLAAYELRGDALKRVEVINADVDQLLAAAFNVPRDPRSPEYKAGARAALDFRANAVRIPHPYTAGSAADDAYHAGIQEGHVIWRKAVMAGAA